jgi:hypothetical protein
VHALGPVGLDVTRRAVPCRAAPCRRAGLLLLLGSLGGAFCCVLFSCKSVLCLCASTLLQIVGGKKHEVNDGGSHARRCAQTTLRHSVGEILNPGNEIDCKCFGVTSSTSQAITWSFGSDSIVCWNCDHALDCLTVF